MELKDIIGQLFILGFLGDTVTRESPIIRDISQHNLGGVILFNKHLATGCNHNNIVNNAQVRQLTEDLQDSAGGKLVISVDQEGGLVSRFKAERGFPETAPAAELGQNSDTSATKQAATQTAALLHELGFTLNLAPVADLNSYAENPIIARYKRSFSAGASEVSSHAECWIREHRHHRIHSCLKHFPGHGSAREDSHLGFVDISASWQKEELEPYRKLLASGLLDAVMTGHLYNSVLDSSYPATLSSATINGLLRNELGFTGPVLSDDMQMKAISSQYGLGQAACLAIAAGVDMILVGNNLDYDPDILTSLTGSVLRAVRDGRLTEERIHEAHARVRQLQTPPAETL